MSSADAASRLAQARDWLRARPYAAAAAVAFGVLAVTFLLRKDSEWDETYVPAAQRLARGVELYRAQGENYLYPPFMAFAALPAALLAPLPGRAVFLLVNLVCLTFLVRGGWQ
jgi:hypothetical protein